MKLMLRCLALLLLSTQLDAAEFRAGAASVVITPPAGTPVAGYYHLRTADGVLDDLYAKALVIEQDGARAAFVTLDLITTTRPVIVEARRLIAEQTGIAPESVMISATHSHTGPVLTYGSTLDELTGGETPLAHSYVGTLPSLIARSVAEANAGLAAAGASVMLLREERLSFNRRFWMNDGTLSWNPPKLDPAIVAPAGPIDPDLGLLHVKTTGAKPVSLAAYVNFALHADVVGGSRISADFPGVLARHLARSTGASTVTLFANGCCGNINHRNVWWNSPQSGPEETERIGTALAGTLLANWSALAPLKAPAPQSRSVMVEIPARQFSADAVESARNVVRQKKSGTVVQAEAFCVLDSLLREGKPYEVEVQVIALGDELAIVSLPGEIFVELGLAIKKASPFKYTFIAELANGSLGYVPNRAAYAEGNYEVVSARGAEGSGERLVDAAVKLLGELKALPVGKR
ncbi:MAG: hypothetical protein V4710_18460 [Verrucomicrobiota bacterium]